MKFFLVLWLLLRHQYLSDSKQSNGKENDCKNSFTRFIIENPFYEEISTGTGSTIKTTKATNAISNNNFISDSTDEEDVPKRSQYTLHKSKLYEQVGGDQYLPIYSNYFVVKMTGNKSKAKDFIESLGYNYVAQVFPGDNYYLVKHNQLCWECAGHADDHIKKLKKEKEILWIAQQKINFNYNRMYSIARGYEDGTSEMNFNDPYYIDQWYLHDLKSHHLNVQTVWKAGYTGRGVKLSILDDGVHPDNPDLGENYDPSISYDYINHRPADKSVPENSHGTSCAGIIAALANNSLCGVGIAYRARVGGCRVLDGRMTDANEAMSLVHALDKVDIYSASWGPRDDGMHMSGPGVLSKRAFSKGVKEGRNGKGVIYVWAAGNGGKYHDNCNMDGYASNMYTIAIGALTAHGRITYYSESCSATLASTYIGGSHIAPNIFTLPLILKMKKVVVPTEHGHCKKNFQGTSAAAPMAAGLIALVLEANPKLTWRDVQHIIIKSARIPNPNEKGWMMNAAGYHYHIKIGFGVMDCGRMISLAQSWTLVGPQNMWLVKKRKIRLLRGQTITSIHLRVESRMFPDDKRIDKLEHVIATINIRHHRRGNLQLYLISPSNTISQILSQRIRDNSQSGFSYWNFKTVHFWGENPNGRWRLVVLDSTPPSSIRRGQENFIKFFSLLLFGTSSYGRETRKKIFRYNLLDKRTITELSSVERYISRSVRVKKNL